MGMNWRNSEISLAGQNKIWVDFKNKIGLLVVVAVLFGFLSFISPYFLTFDNIINVILQISINCIAAYGATFVIILGGIDLSVGGIMLMVGIIMTNLVKLYDISLVGSIIINLFIALGFGLLTGLFSTKLRIPVFIVTLGMANVTKGIGLVYSDGKPIYIDDELFNTIGNGTLGPIPLPIIYMLIIFVILFLVLNYTKFGRHVYATGGNEEAARFSGINVNKVKIISYTMAAGLSGLGGIILSARLTSGQPTVGNGAELDAIAAVIMGGASLNGGVGTLTGTMIGALIMGIINNGLNLLGINPYWQYIAKGIVILIAVYASATRSKRLELGR